MSNKLENAKNLYLQGIKEGRMEVVEEYSGERYTQHSTGVEDGVKGFTDFFAGFLSRLAILKAASLFDSKKLRASSFDEKFLGSFDLNF